MKQLLSLAVVLAIVAQAQATIVVESRDGQNNAWLTTAGTWANSGSKSTAPGLTGTASLYSSNAYTGRSFTVAPDFGSGGLYEVFVTAAADMGAQPVTVVHTGGTDNFVADLTTGVANAWKSIGQWTFNPGFGDSVTIASHGAGGAVLRADAVKFEYIPEPASLLLLALGGLLVHRRRG